MNLKEYINNIYENMINTNADFKRFIEENKNESEQELMKECGHDAIITFLKRVPLF